MIFSHDLSHFFQVKVFKGLSHFKCLVGNSLKLFYKQIRIVFPLGLDMIIHFRSIGRYPAVTQHNFNGFFNVDPLPGLVSIFYMVKNEPAISRRCIIHPARRTMVGEFPLPPNMVNFIDGECQIKFII